MSAGVSIHWRIGRHSSTVHTVIAKENPTASHNMLPTKRLSSLKSLEPKLWATGMANPEHTPTQNPTIKKFTEPVEPTAARGPVPKKRPTMMVSTME